MLDKKTTAKILVLLSLGSRNPYDKRMIHPRREWLLGLFVFLLIVIVGGIKSVVVFLQYQNISTDNGVYEEKVIQYSDVLADNALMAYTQRKDNFLALQQNLPPVVSISTSTATTSSEVASTTEIVAEPAVEVAP